MKQVKVAISDTCGSNVAEYCAFPDIRTLHLIRADRDSAVGIATRYGLDGSRFKSRWGRDFLHPSGTSLEPTQPYIQWVPGLSRG